MSLAFVSENRFRGSPSRPSNAEALVIVREAAAEYGVTSTTVLGPRRWRELIPARQEAMARIRERLLWSLPRIAELFCRDHTTVLHAIRMARGADPVRRVAVSREGAIVVAERAAEPFGVSFGEMAGDARRPEIREARVAAVAALRSIGATYTFIGLIFGRHHSAVHKWRL